MIDKTQVRYISEILYSGRDFRNGRHVTNFMDLQLIFVV